MTSPIYSSLAFIGGKIEASLDGYIFLVGVSRENEILKQQVKDLKMNLLEYRELKSENQRLRDLLSMPLDIPFPYVAGKRIFNGVSPYQKSIRVRFRASEMVIPGTAVFNEKGVIGQVVKVAGNHADVLLLVDKISSIDVINQRTRKRSLLRGDTINTLRFEYLPVGSDIREGDELVSSGLDGIYPKGVPVGFVSQVGQRRQQLFLDAQAKPYVDYDNLEEVSIVVRRDG